MEKLATVYIVYICRPGTDTWKIDALFINKDEAVAYVEMNSYWGTGYKISCYERVYDGTLIEIEN